MLLSAPIPWLLDLLIIFGLSIAVQLICHRLKVPAVMGFLLTGIVAGPHATGLIKDIDQVSLMAEIGVILLLFTLGMEFSFERLMKIRKLATLGGGIQVGMTLLFTILISRQLQQSWETSIFIGFLVSLSSTAIVIRILQQKAQMDTPHGRTVLGILIFQDVMIVPMMLITPLLAGTSSNIGEDLLWMILKIIGLAGIVWILARYLVPKLMTHITSTRVQEVFLMSVIALCLGVTFLTASLGLSLSLGAFVAGLIIADSEYSHQALSSILPFRDIFSSLFFISIGMLLNVSFVGDHFVWVLLLLMGVLVMKGISGGLAGMGLRLPLRTLIITSVCLVQVGEFAFVLVGIGRGANLLTDAQYQLFLSVSILTMLLTPGIIGAATGWAERATRSRFARLYGKILPDKNVPPETRNWLKNHLIIIGFGLNGRNLALAARENDIPYIIIEANPDTVRKERKKRQPIVFGDATHAEVLHHAEIKRARVAVVAISDVTATRHIVHTLRRLNGDLKLIVRTRYVTEIKPLQDLGADMVIPEEFETSVEIFTRVLEDYKIPHAEIETFANQIRQDNYALFREGHTLPLTVRKMRRELLGVDFTTFRIHPRSVLIGSSLSNSKIRSRFQVSVVALQRELATEINPNPEAILHAGDILYLVGQEQHLQRFRQYASESPAA